MELKYIEELNSLINDFIRPCGCKAEVDTDFAYYPNEKVVTWSPFMMDKADKYFSEFVTTKYAHITADIFLWSLLHEVGHHVTYNKWQKNELENFTHTKELLENYINKFDISEEEEKDLYIGYFKLGDELCATEWAAQYMENYAGKIKKFWKKFIKVFNKFLVLNNIE